jgi:hypothetical protein
MGLSSNAARAIGRRVGELVASQVKSDVTKSHESLRRLSGPLLCAVVDAFLADRIVLATWPSILVLVAVVSIHVVGLLGLSQEGIRILVGAIIFAALAWSAYALAKGAVKIWPYLCQWYVTLLSPTLHARLMLFHYIRRQHHTLTDMTVGAGFKTDMFGAALREFQDSQQIGPDRLAFGLAEHLAPVLVRHLLRRAVVLVLPVALALGYYRYSVYPDVVARYTSVGPWGVAVYPLAAAIDTVVGTHLRAFIALR